MTDNTQELDGILDRYLDSQWNGNMRQAILDWHNKQIEKERLLFLSEIQVPLLQLGIAINVIRKRFSESTAPECYDELKSIIEAERNKLKEK